MGDLIRNIVGNCQKSKSFGNKLKLFIKIVFRNYFLQRWKSCYSNYQRIG
jgi:hypothetical protein